jgi:hypothetical protein
MLFGGGAVSLCQRRWRLFRRRGKQLWLKPIEDVAPLNKAIIFYENMLSDSNPPKRSPRLLTRRPHISEQHDRA